MINACTAYCEVTRDDRWISADFDFTNELGVAFEKFEGSQTQHEPKSCFATNFRHGGARRGTTTSNKIYQNQQLLPIVVSGYNGTGWHIVYSSWFVWIIFLFHLCHLFRYKNSSLLCAIRSAAHRHHQNLPSSSFFRLLVTRVCACVFCTTSTDIHYISEDQESESPRIMTTPNCKLPLGSVCVR